MANASSVLRMSGMNSGLDTEAIVNALTATTKNKINTSQRKVLKLQAQQEAYRTVIGAFNEFKSKYFDMTNINTCLKSGSLFNSYKSEVSGFDGKTINGVTISCANNANPDNYDVKVDQVATQATYKSSEVAGTPIDLSSCFNGYGWMKDIDFAMNVTVNGNTKNITFKGGIDEESARNNLNAALKETFGAASGDRGKVYLDAENKIVTVDNSIASATTPARFYKERAVEFTPGTGNNTYTVYCNGSYKKLSFSTVANNYFNEIFDESGNLREEPPETKADGTAYTEAEKQAYNDKVNLFKEVAQNTRGKDVYDKFNAWEEGLSEPDKATHYDDIIDFQQQGELDAAKDEYYLEAKVALYNKAVADGTYSSNSSDENYKSFDDFINSPEGDDAAVEAYFATTDGQELKTKYDEKVQQINDKYDAMPSTETLDGAKEALAKAEYNKGIADGTVTGTFDDFKASKTYTNEQAKAYLYEQMSQEQKQLYYEKEIYTTDGGKTEEDFLSGYTAAEAAKDLNEANFENNLGALQFGTVSLEVTFAKNDKGKDTIVFKAKGSSDNATFALTQNPNNATRLFGNIAYENSATGGGIANQIDTSSTIDALGLTAGADGKFSFTINGQSFSFDGTATIREVMKKVNASEAGVKMTYTSLTNQFTLTSNAYGMNANITVQDGAGGLMHALGFEDRTGKVDEASAGFTRGENTILQINGNTIETDSNSFEFDGITMSFTQAAEGAHFSNDVKRDYSKPIQVIKDFVKDYNALIDLVNGYLNDKPNKDYYFLTDDDLDEMDLSESKEEKWEKLAKKGILYHDSAITGIMSKLRSAVYNTVEAPDGKNIGLFTLGITTTETISNRGKLKFDSSIDDEKFEMIFSEYADEFATLFNDAEKGIANQFSDIIDSAVKTSGDYKDCGILVQKAGVSGTTSDTNNSIYKQIQSLKNTIDNLQNRYDQQQDRYWKIYSNMEKQLGALNGQTSYISQLTNSLGG